MSKDFWANPKVSERDGSSNKLVCAPASRNRGPILEVLRRLLPEAPRVFEVGSGTGQHVAHFTGQWPTLVWQPSEVSEAGLASIVAYREECDASRFLEPVRFDVTTDSLPEGRWDAVFSANVIHITPWRLTEAIVDVAGRTLPPGGWLVFYGPFRISGRFTAESNAEFDARLKGMDPSFGVRDTDAIFELARSRGFSAPELVEMPANNYIVAFGR